MANKKFAVLFVKGLHFQHKQRGVINVAVRVYMHVLVKKQYGTSPRAISDLEVQMAVK